jgi:ABC-2 type transport system permease protein
VSTDTQAGPGPDGAAPGYRPGPDGAAPGYRPGRTLSVRAEWARQARRRRTQLALGFMVALPLIMLGAFQLGNNDDEPAPPAGGRLGSLVDLATSGGLNFALFTIVVSAGFLLVVVVALFFGDTVASEASWGSLRYLLAAPVPRSRLLAAKLVVATGYSLLAMLLLAGTALAAGTLRYGWEPLRSVVAAEVPAGAGLVRLLLVLGYIGVGLMVVAALAFLLSVVTDAPLGAVGGAVLLYILSSILDQITALGDLRTLLPTHFSDAWLGFLSTPIETGDAVRGAISAVCYATGFCALAWWRFLRRDIVS